MELTIDQALQKGVEAHKAGQVQEADRLYTAILQSQPKHPDANHNMGVLAVGVGKAQEALPFFKTALEANPSTAQFWLSYIDALIKLERLADAQAVFDQAKSNGAKGDGFDQLEQRLEAVKLPTSMTSNTQDPPQDQLQPLIKLYSQGQLQKALEQVTLLLKQYPNSSVLHNMSGVVFNGLGQLDSAVGSYKKALVASPYFAVAYYNMGSALKEQGKLEEAIEAYNKALALKPDNAEAYNNMGLALQDQGKLEEAIEAYNNALALKPDLTECFVNLKMLTMQMPDFDLTPLRYNNQRDSMRSDVLSQYPKYQVQQAISNFMLGKPSLSTKNLKQYSALSQRKDSQNFVLKDQVFCDAYFNFLNSLIANNSNSNHLVHSNIHHVGESHCLSYAYSKINIKKTPYVILPRIIFGAKAFHFSAHTENLYKALTENNLKNIPRGSEVFISIGEIDCRAYEGIIQAANKTGRSLNETTTKTVHGYIEWFLNQNIINQHNYYFFNVPAPMYNNTYSEEMNNKVAKVVALFNKILLQKTSSSQTKIIDVYCHTENKKGFSNGLYHCDKYHLDSKTIPLIQDQLT